MDRRIAVCSIAGALAFVATSCSAAFAGNPKRLQSDRQAPEGPVVSIVESQNRFAFDLYQRLAADEQENLFFSPASISMALAMTYAGAAENTEAEMAKTLHLNLPKAQVAEAMKALRESWNANGARQGYRLDVANRLWGQAGYKFLPAFLEVTRVDYGAELAPLDFKAEADKARETINAWIADHTQGKIENLIPSASILRDARLVLTNAVYFKGEWQEPFNKSRTKEDTFHVAANQQVQAPFMQARHHFRYGEVGGLQVLELPYGDGDLSMVILLPKKVDGLGKLEKKLTAGSFQKWTTGLASREVIVFLPKFKTTAQFQLADALKSLGMHSAFDPTTADFSGMTGSKEGLFISAVLHKAFVDVNEEGTEAAAATGIVMHPTAIRVRPHQPPVFRADHPFVFAIQHKQTGAVLFLGRMTDPSK
jgi:serpin B